MTISAKKLLVAALMTMAVIAGHCSSGDKIEKLAVGEKRDIKDADGKVIGQYEQISATQGVYRIDQNDDGRFEKSIHMTEGKVTSVDYDNDQNGVVDKTVFYEDEKPVRVTVYSKRDQSILGIGNVTEKKISSVDLPGKNKRVYFKEDGSIDRIETLK